MDLFMRTVCRRVVVKGSTVQVRIHFRKFMRTLRWRAACGPRAAHLDSMGQCGTRTHSNPSPSLRSKYGHPQETCRKSHQARAGIVFGWVFAAHQLGAATAAYGAGLTRTLLLTYTPALFAAGAACLLAAFAVLAIARPLQVSPRP